MQCSTFPVMGILTCSELYLSSFRHFLCFTDGAAARCLKVGELLKFVSIYFVTFLWNKQMHKVNQRKSVRWGTSAEWETDNNSYQCAFSQINRKAGTNCQNKMIVMMDGPLQYYTHTSFIMSEVYLNLIQCCDNLFYLYLSTEQPWFLCGEILKCLFTCTLKVA